MANPKRALVLAVAFAFAGAANAQRVTTTTTGATGAAATTNTTKSIPMPAITAPAPSGAATSASTSSGSSANTSGSVGASGSTSGTSGAVTATDTSTLTPSNLTSGTANNLPTGTDNAGGATAATPAPFDSGTGTLLGAPVVGTALPAEDYVIGPNGERIPVNRGSATTPAPTAAETQQNLAASRALDARLAKDARETRERVARKGQVLNSITPRTDVDRTDQMPDDSTPLLSPARR